VGCLPVSGPHPRGHRVTEAPRSSGDGFHPPAGSMGVEGGIAGRSWQASELHCWALIAGTFTTSPRQLLQRRGSDRVGRLLLAQGGFLVVS